jgi:hypothetical protein
MQSSSYVSTPGAKKLSTAKESGKKSFCQVMDEYLARCKAKPRPKRPRGGQYTDSDPLIKFLRQHVSRLNYGVKVPGIGVRPELDENENW